MNQAITESGKDRKRRASNDKRSLMNQATTENGKDRKRRASNDKRSLMNQATTRVARTGSEGHLMTRGA